MSKWQAWLSIKEAFFYITAVYYFWWWSNPMQTVHTLLCHPTGVFSIWCSWVQSRRTPGPQLIEDTSSYKPRKSGSSELTDIFDTCCPKWLDLEVRLASKPPAQWPRGRWGRGQPRSVQCPCYCLPWGCYCRPERCWCWTLGWRCKRSGSGQIWSLTQLYSVEFLQSKVIEKKFCKHKQGFVSVPVSLTYTPATRDSI